jgi:sulfite exporter TauE/SafE
MSLWLIFLTGLTTGGISCVALQAGLLISAISGYKSSPQKPIHDLNFKPIISISHDWLPVALFLISKLIAYMILGALLGAFGSVLSLNLTTRVILQSLTAFYMLATAMNLLNVHPIFRYVVLTPPKFIQHRIRQTSKNQNLFSPIILGAFTILIPCGITQAMEVIAVSSGNPVIGALTMGSFVLGTIPMFTLIGIATAKFSGLWQTRFLRFAAVLLIFMSLYSLNGALTVMDAPVSFNKLLQTYQAMQRFESSDSTLGTTSITGLQQITINVSSSGYEPRYLKVNHNQPVELTVHSQGVYSCASSFTLKAFNIFTQLKPTDSQIFTFTPSKPGRYTYSCSMGMYSGTLEVI